MKKFFAALLALVLCFSLVACGKDGKKKDDKKDNESVNENVNDEQTTAEPVETQPNIADDKKRPSSIYDVLIGTYYREKIPYTYKADDDGNEIERTYYDEKTKDVFAVFTYEYKDGELCGITVIEYKINCEMEYIFDGDEKLLTKTDTYANGNYTIGQYHDNGKVKISESFIKSKDSITWTVSHFNEKGRISKKIYKDADGKETGYTLYEYDSKGNVVSEEYYDAN